MMSSRVHLCHFNCKDTRLKDVYLIAFTVFPLYLLAVLMIQRVWVILQSGYERLLVGFLIKMQSVICSDD